MKKIIKFETDHLYLRQWIEEDLTEYAKITSNKEIMRYFPKLLSREESDLAVQKFQNLLIQRDWGFWAVEEKESGKFLGYAGLHSPSTTFSFSPCVEIAWRMHEESWNKTYILESGKVILDHALNELKMEEIVYFSSVLNKRAEAFVSSLGMLKQQETFSHPFVAKEHPLSEHYLYKIKNILP